MKIFVQNYNNVANQVIDTLETTEDVMKADKFVTWNDVMPDQILLVDFAHKKGKKVIVLQHGSKGTSRYYSPFNQPVIADKICVWGENMKKRLLGVGTPKEKIEITGTPITKMLVPKVEHEGTNIVFSPEHWGTEVPENRDTANRLKKIKDITIYTKILPEHKREWYPNPIVGDRNNPANIGIIAGLLAKADLVVGLMEGTFELLAEAMDIPVVIMTDWKPKDIAGDQRYKQYSKRLSKACKQTSLDKLIETIEQQLDNPDELKEERKLEAINEGGVNIENPLENIIRVIKNA